MKAWMGRNAREFLRDPLTLIFGVGLPILMLGMMAFINSAVPVTVWQFLPENFVPAMAVFSLAFMTLFSGLLLAKDRTSAFLSRICASPLRASAYILGYLLPMLLVALVQGLVCLFAGLLFGLTFSWRIFAVELALLPYAVLAIATGLLLGTLLNDKQVGSISGGLLVTLTSLAGGIWFDLRMFSDAMQKVLYALPFAPAVDTARAAYAGDWASMRPHLLVTVLWAAGMLALTIWLFHRRKENGKLTA